MDMTEIRIATRMIGLSRPPREVTQEQRSLIGNAIRTGISLCGMVVSDVADTTGVDWDFFDRFLAGYPNVCTNNDLGVNGGVYGTDYLALVRDLLKLIEKNMIDRNDGLTARERLCIRVYKMEEVYELCD